jgi:hypothetical protein
MRFCAAKRITASDPNPQHNNINISPPNDREHKEMVGDREHKEMVGDREHKEMVGDRIDSDAFSRGEKRILRRNLEC